MAADDERSGRLSRRKELLFRALGVAFPLLVLGVCELALRACDVQFDPYVRLRQRTSVVSEVEIQGRRHLRVSHPEAYAARGTQFPLEKPENGLRIFAFGGSASAGWPHPGGEVYTAYLEGALAAAFPDFAVQVVNLSAHAHASYRVRAIFEDVIDYDPDLVLIYSGNNEFLERRSYWADSPVARRARALARDSRVVGGLTYLLGPLLPGAASLEGSTALAQAQETTMSFVNRTARELRSDPAQFDAVKEHYAHGIRSMVRVAERRGIPVVLLTVPVNLADWVPHVSVDRLEGDALERWRGLFLAGRRAQLEGDAEQALRHFDGALRLEPDHAEAHFWRARALEALGRNEAALQAYGRARDLDQNPFRAISSFNETLRRIASEQETVTLFDAERLFRQAARGAAPGFDLFLDYVHPTRRGNRLLARGAFQVIVANDLLGVEPDPSARPEFIGRPGYRDPLDVPMQLLLVWVMGMTRQEEAMLAKAAEIRALGPTRHAGMSPGEVKAMDEFLADVDAAISPRVELAEAEIRGELVAPEIRDRVEREAVAFYERYYASERRPWRRDRIRAASAPRVRGAARPGAGARAP